MTRTPLGLAAEAAAWLTLGAAFLLGSWGMALGAFGALAVLASARPLAGTAAPRVRAVLEGEARQGAVVKVAVEVEGGGLDAEVPVPLGATLLRERRERTAQGLRVEQDVQLVAVGALAWPPVEVAVADPWGLRSELHAAPGPGPVAVTPDAGWALRGRRLGLKNPVQHTIKAPAASERSLDIERVRPYVGGDTLRDIDWKATSRFQGLHSRERERHVPRPVTVVLDCGATMQVQRNDSKLLSAARVAYGTLAAATGAGTTCHLVAVHGDRVAARPVAGLRDAEAALTAILAACPPLAPHEATPGTVGAAAVAQAVGNAPGLQVLVLDAECDPRLAIELLPLLKLRGPVALAVPATGAHLYRRHEARREVLRALRAWRRNRNEVLAAARALRIPAWVLRPGGEDEVLGRIGRLLA
ncbi:MAG TPA: DUF58 domain-containing protein [Candidatus Thermoplasmatota archaeon]|nr:DUF58 domain-containing protein [Candidatus Thermoplasmatota archaeon]